MKAYKPTQKKKTAAKSVGKACVPERKKPFKKPVNSGAQEEDLSVYTQKEERQTRVRRKTEEKAAQNPAPFMASAARQPQRFAARFFVAQMQDVSK